MMNSIRFRQSTKYFPENATFYAGTTTLRDNDLMSNELASTHITDSAVV